MIRPGKTTDPLRLASLLGLIAWLALPPLAVSVEMVPRTLTRELDVAPLDQSAVWTVPALNFERLKAEDLQRDQLGLPYRFAEPTRVQLTTENSGSWVRAADGTELWRLRIDSPGALSMNLGFVRCRLSQGMRLAIHSPDGVETFAFDAGDNKSHGQLWTPILPGPQIVLELAVPRGGRENIDLELGTIASGYRGFHEPRDEKGDWCEIDVVCSEGDEWRDEIDAVGVYTVSGIWKCTGTLVANTRDDGRPLFLTAHHCDIDTDNAASVVVYWNYQSPTCGQQGGGSLASFQSGSTLLADYSPTDFSLIELDEIPDAALGVRYAGWDRSDADPDSVVCIHHPQVEEKSISFDFDATRRTSWNSEVTPGDATHLMVEDWDLGTTEGGSSGSALFNTKHRIVGQLHGGWAACGNDRPDWYGRLAASWDGGGTQQSRLADHLDPLGTGLQVFPIVFPLEVDGLDDWAPSGPVGGPFRPDAAMIRVSNPSTDSRSAVITTDVRWLEVPAGPVPIPAGGSTDLELALENLAVDLPSGDHAATITVEETVSGQRRDYEILLRVGGAAQLIVQDAAPNPFSSYVELGFNLGTSLPYRARVWDLRGRQVRDLGTRQGLRGANQVTWDGLSDGGARAAAGVYILQIQAGDEEARVRVLAMH